MNETQLKITKRVKMKFSTMSERLLYRTTTSALPNLQHIIEVFPLNKRTVKMLLADFVIKPFQFMTYLPLKKNTCSISKQNSV